MSVHIERRKRVIVVERDGAPDRIGRVIGADDQRLCIVGAQHRPDRPFELSARIMSSFTALM